MKDNTFYVWLHPDFIQVDGTEVDAWERSIDTIGRLPNSLLTMVTWNKQSPARVGTNDLCNLYHKAQNVLGDRFTHWRNGQFIEPKYQDLVLKMIGMKPINQAVCYGLHPEWCGEDQKGYLEQMAVFDSVVNIGYAP